MKKIFAILIITTLLAGASGNTTVQAVSSQPDNAGQLKSVRYISYGDGEAVEISVTGYSDYSIMKLSNPERIVIDIFNATAPGKQQYVEAGGSAVKAVRYAQFEPYTARVVLEVNGEPEYGVNKTDAGLLVFFGDVPENTAADSADSTKNEGTAPPPAANAVKKALVINKYFTVEFTPGGSVDYAGIIIGSYKNYKVARLTGPDRLVIDIPNAKYSSTDKKIETNGSRIKSVRYTKYGKSTARIILDLTDQSNYTVAESKGKLFFTVQKPEYKNITYHNNGDRVYFVIKGAKLTEGDEFLKCLYTGSYDRTGLKYTVTFPAGQADIGSGVFRINDEYIKTLETADDPGSGTARLTFASSVKLDYLIYTRSNLHETVITLLKPAPPKDKLVVIDAGHGGSMPGAIYKSVVEKDINLDIAGRLNTLLEKKGIKTYMIRDDDSDVANYERTYIANRLKASLFVSIHSNAMDDPGYRGTMTLYYPGGSSKTFNGQTFAAIIQQKLLAALKTTDRKTVGRPNLVVLRATNMPSALAEVAFITNSSDRANLQKSSFRQKAAQGLCDSVLKALPKV